MQGYLKSSGRESQPRERKKVFHSIKQMTLGKSILSHKQTDYWEWCQNVQWRYEPPDREPIEVLGRV